jgi:hypothetical protein
MSAAARHPAGSAGGQGRGGREPGGQRRGGREPGGPGVHVGRLALRVTGLHEDEARTLGHLVAQELQAGLLGAASQAHLDRVRIQVTADEQGRPELLARRIADELGRILARGQGPGHPGGGTVR